MNLSLCPVAEKGAHIPRAPALIIDETIISYHKLDALINATQARVRREGFSPLQPVPFMGENRLETIALLFALFREGHIAFPQSPRLPSPKKPILFSSRCAESLSPLIDQSVPAVYLFTSGSQGKPKIASLSLSNFIASAQGALPSLNLKSGDRYLLSLPLYHVGGLSILFRCFLAGATCVLSSLPVHQALKQHAITHASFVPTQLYTLLQQSPEVYPHLKCLLLGGAALPDSIYKEGIERGLPLMTSWGMTETASLVTLNGDVLPNREVKIDKTGEIHVRGPVLFQGYKDDSIKPGTWFATKDLGEWKGGKLSVLGRKDNLFISGGENIQPEEIERALCSLEGVIEAIVVPKEDPKWGSRPVAFLRHKEGHKLSLDAIHELLRDQLEKFKLPVAIHPLPETKTLKTTRQGLASGVDLGSP